MITLTAAKRNLLVHSFIIGLVLFFSGLPGLAQTPNILFTPVVTSGLSFPCDVVNAGDGSNRLFIAELGGAVKIVQLPAGTLMGTFLDIADSTDNVGEGGLLSIAFHPDFENNRYLYVFYTTNGGNLRITRFQTYPGNPNLVDETTGTVLMTIPHPGQSNHNGGKLNFGPDGNLYIGFGDGGGGGDPSNNAQNGATLLGKMIRVNVDDFLTPPYYTIPADNPYVGVSGVDERIYNFGLRNPWRWSFDRQTGDVWIADVGQGQLEEVNYTPFASSAALNYGWRCYEGSVVYNSAGCGAPGIYTFPLFEYDHTLGHSITGGYVFRSPSFHVLEGWYICADYIINNAWVMKPDGMGGVIFAIQNAIPNNIVGFGEAENAALYALSLNGSLYRIESSTPYLPLTLLQFTAKAFTAYNELKWKTTNEISLSHYEIEYSSNGRDYTYAGRVDALNGPSENDYSFQHPAGTFTKIYYRLKTVEKNGRHTHSHLIWLDGKERTDVKVYPTLIKGNVLNIVSSQPVEQVSFFSAEGKNVFQTRLNNLSGTISISIPRIQRGVYFVQLKLKDGYVYEKVLIQQD